MPADNDEEVVEVASIKPEEVCLECWDILLSKPEGMRWMGMFMPHEGGRKCFGWCREAKGGQ